MNLDAHRAVVLDGEGVVARSRRVLAVSSDPAALPDGDTLPVADAPVAAIWWTEQGTTSYACRGGATVSVDGTTLAPSPEPVFVTIADHATVRIGLPAAQDAEPPQWADLRDGVVAGAGALLVPDAAPPPMPEPAPSPAAGFDWVDLRTSSADVDERPALAVGVTGPVDTDDAGEVVQGIMCSRGHFNNPAAAYCQVCGISMVHLTHGLVDGIRPTMGFLVFDNGATYALDRDYVAGRSPQVAESERASPLTIVDEELSVSGTHARIDLSGWDVMLSDLGSTNGTFIWDGDRRQWDHVPANTPTVLPPGSIAAFGRQTFVFESAVRRR